MKRKYVNKGHTLSKGKQEAKGRMAHSTESKCSSHKPFACQVGYEESHFSNCSWQPALQIMFGKRSKFSTLYNSCTHIDKKKALRCPNCSTNHEFSFMWLRHFSKWTKQSSMSNTKMDTLKELVRVTQYFYIFTFLQSDNFSNFLSLCCFLCLLRHLWCCSNKYIWQII